MGTRLVGSQNWGARPVPWGGRDTPKAVPGGALWIPRPVVPRDWSPIPRWQMSGGQGGGTVAECTVCSRGPKVFFFFFLKEKLAPLQDLKHSTLCSKYSTGYFKKPHLVVAPTALPQEDSVVPNVRRECRQPNKLCA